MTPKPGEVYLVDLGRIAKRAAICSGSAWRGWKENQAVWDSRAAGWTLKGASSSSCHWSGRAGSALGANEAGTRILPLVRGSFSDQSTNGRVAGSLSVSQAFAWERWATSKSFPRNRTPEWSSVISTRRAAGKLTRSSCEALHVPLITHESPSALAFK